MDAKFVDNKDVVRVSADLHAARRQRASRAMRGSRLCNGVAGTVAGIRQGLALRPVMVPDPSRTLKGICQVHGS
jgi:hypothetical protein